jgi:hypothetical protein
MTFWAKANNEKWFLDENYFHNFIAEIAID